jgi:transposase
MISRFDSPSAVRRWTYARVCSWDFIGTIRMRCRALLAGLAPCWWTPFKRGCSLWEIGVGSSARSAREEAVGLVVNTGRPIAVVAGELGVSDKSLGRWVSDYRACQEVAGGLLGESERAELARLRREVSELKMDGAFLKKASIFNA